MVNQSIIIQDLIMDKVPNLVYIVETWLDNSADPLSAPFVQHDKAEVLTSDSRM